MDFLKKHYEKIALSLALLGLVGTAVWVFLAIQQTKQDVEGSTAQAGAPTPFPKADLAPYTAAMTKAGTPVLVDLGNPHMLFNPSTWKRKTDGTLIKMQSSNPADALAITKITPLNLTLNFERVAGTGYYFGINKEAAPRLVDRKKVQRYLNPAGKADLGPGTSMTNFTLVRVEGPAEAPERLVLVLNESKQEVVITPTQPFKLLEGYAVDLSYSVDNKTFVDQRVNSVITFGGETYKIIAITENEVRVQANSNQKQTTIRRKPTP